MTRDQALIVEDFGSEIILGRRAVVHNNLLYDRFVIPPGGVVPKSFRLFSGRGDRDWIDSNMPGNFRLPQEHCKSQTKYVLL